MSDQFPSLARTMERHSFWLANHSSIGSEAHCRCGFRPRDWWAWSEHVEQVWREACTVTSVEQLDALPDGTVIHTVGHTGELPEDAYGSGAWTKCRDTGGDWYWWAMDFGEPASEVPLPARVIHHPDWETK